MQRILLTLIFVISFGMVAFAQVPGGSTCEDAAPICSDLQYNFPLQTNSTAQAGPNYGCLGSTPNPVWYFMQIETAGNIEMSLTAGQDIDFIIWGPFPDITCDNSDLSGANIVDCSYSATNLETPSIPNGMVGEVYMIMITNFANTQQNFTLEQTGGTGGTDCDIVSCLADAGDISFTPDVAACEMDASLNLNIIPFYPGGGAGPDPVDYSYTYIISDAITGVILNYMTPADLSSMAPGNYNVCGLSYLTADGGLIPPADGVLTVTDLATSLFSTMAPFCGDVTLDCINVLIGAAPLPSIIDTTICDGETVVFDGNVLVNTGQYIANLVTPAGCDSMVTLNLTVLPPSILNATETICNGDFVTYNFVDYYSPGLFNIVTQTPDGCDSTIYLDLTVLYSYIDIDVVGVLDCISTQVLLDGSGSATGPGVAYQWYLDGVLIPGSTNSVHIATIPGVYTLDLTNSLNGVTCMDSDSVTIVSQVTNMDITADPYGDVNCANPLITIPINLTIGTSNYTLNWFTTNGNIVGGSTGDEVVVDQPGTYFVTLLNLDNTCSITVDFEVLGDVTLPNVTASTTNINCNADALLNGNTTTANATTLWSGPGVSDPNAPNTTANMPGTYTFTVTSVNGCTDSLQFLVSSSVVQPIASAGTDQTLDCITVSLDIDGSGSSSNPNDVYLWTGPGIDATNENDISPTINLSGTYILTVQNTASSCVDTDTVEVALNGTLPNVELNDNPTITCTVTSVDLISTGSDVGDNFVYTWSGTGVEAGDESNENITVTESGVYTLTILNTDNSCPETAQVEVLVNQTNPTADAGSNVEITCADPTNNLEGVNSTAGVEYSWSGPGVVGDNSVVSPTINAPGEYILTVTDPINGCIDTDTVLTTSLDNIPEALILEPLVLTCNVLDVDLVAGNINPGYSYEWTLPDLSEVDGTMVNTSTVGEYTLVVTDDATGCPNSTNIMVTQNITAPNITPTVDDMLTCDVVDVDINAGNENGLDLAYTWSGPGIDATNQNDQNPNVTMQGLYSLTYIDNSNGCTNTANVSVGQNITPPMTLAGDPITLTCIDDASIANLVNPIINDDVTYTWAGTGIDATNQNGVNQIFTDEGIYILTVTDEINGCEVVSELEVIENKNLPDASGTGGMLNCLINDVQITASSTTQFAQFEWLDPNGIPLIGPNPMVNEPGQYSLTVTGLNGCINTDVAVMVDTDFALPNVQSQGGQINCINNSVDLIGLSTTPQSTFEWLQGNNSLVNGDTYTANAGGVYSFVVTGPNGCTDDIDVIVDEDFDKPIFTINELGEIDCVSDESSVVLSLQTSGDYDYSWDGTGNSYEEMPGNQGIVVNEAGTYALTIIDNSNGCQEVEEIQIEDKTDEPVADINISDITCFGETNGAVTITEVTGGVAPYLYGLNGGVMSQNPITVGLGAGEYSYQIEDAIGCSWETTFTVAEPEQNVIDIVPDQSLINLGDSTILTLQVSNNTQIDSVVWTGEISSYISDFSVVVKPTHSTTYEAKLIDDNGCTTDAFFYLELNADRDIFVPYGFTPNNDGVNDFAFIQSGDQVEVISKFLIVDRWGEIVFENYNFNPNVPNEGWDGLINGQPLNSAVFMYYAEAVYIDGLSKSFKGDITLIK